MTQKEEVGASAAMGPWGREEGGRRRGSLGVLIQEQLLLMKQRLQQMMWAEWSQSSARPRCCSVGPQQDQELELLLLQEEEALQGKDPRRGRFLEENQVTYLEPR